MSKCSLLASELANKEEPRLADIDGAAPRRGASRTDQSPRQCDFVSGHIDLRLRHSASRAARTRAPRVRMAPARVSNGLPVADQKSAAAALEACMRAPRVLGGVYICRRQPAKV